jgi:hypothetical protein
MHGRVKKVLLKIGFDSYQGIASAMPYIHKSDGAFGRGQFVRRI